MCRREDDRGIPEVVDEWSDEFLACLGQWDEPIARPGQQAVWKIGDSIG